LRALKKLFEITILNCRFDYKLIVLMNPAFVSIGLFVFLIVFAFWLSLDFRKNPCEIGKNGLPLFKNPPPPHKQKKEVCFGCWSAGVVKYSPFDVNFVATICDGCEKKAIAFNEWIKSENERLTAELNEKRNELDLLEKSKVVYEPIEPFGPIVINAFKPIETIEPIVFEKFQKAGRRVRKVTAIKPEDDK
jgi:hypothetical protein